MRKALLFVALCIVALCKAQVGTWKTHMSYYEPQEIVKATDNYLFVRASNGLYQYNLQDHSITTYDRSNQLNDTKIQKIAWNAQAKRLLVIYDNANIDIVDVNGNVRNISSIYIKPLTQAKTLYTVYMYQKYAYIGMGFGMTKIDMEKAEISETYIRDTPVTHISVEDGFVYIRVGGNLFYRCSLNKSIIDGHNWEQTKSMDSLFATDTSTWDQYIDLVKTLKVVGPKYNYFGFLRFKNGKLYSASGEAGSTLAREGTLQIYDGTDWTFLQDDMTGVDGTESSKWAFVDTYSVDVDPRDSKHIFAGGRPGLFEFYDGKLVKYYHKDNSMLNPATTSNRYVRVACVEYDNEGNLWILQREVAENSVMEITTDGEWHSYYQEDLMYDEKSLAGLRGLIRDSRGLMWMVNNNWQKPSFYCFDPKTKKIVNSMTTLVNQDGVISETFFPQCIAEDMNGDLWLGTSSGLYLIEASTIGSPLTYVTQVKVPRNDGTDYADYLMDGVYITCIAVDQANRKWIGTNGAGLYLISADNMEQLENFTSVNSPLISNNIEALAINHETGEVFIGTDQGLCSYMSDATIVSIDMTKDDVYAYPNPVVSGYDGLITIVGLTRDADVKILTVNGQLVAQGRSNGGSFTWNGRDSRGNRVASGVYMVATAKSDGSKGTVCKIAVIR